MTRSLAVLALVLFAASSSAAAPDVTVEANPPRLVLGKDRAADLSVRITVPGQVSEVKFFTNVGRATTALPGDDGRWIARLEPPKEFYPQAAIVVAVATVDGRRVAGWTVVPMWGQGALEVNGAPGADLEVKIGDRRYGPVKAGADGKASVPIEVAPGETEAIAGDGVLPLGGVDFPRAVAVALDPRVEVRPGLAARARVRFFVVSARGEPVASAKLRLIPSRGNVDLPEKVEPGVFATQITLPAGARPGRVDLRWRLATSEATRGTLRVFAEKAAPMVARDLEPYPNDTDGAETDLIIEAPLQLVLGRDASADVHVQLPPGMTLRSEPRLYANVGTFVDVKSDADGVRATYVPPEELYPQLAILSAVVDIEGTAHVGVRPLALAGVGNVRVRGKRRSPITLTIGDASFGPVKANAQGWAVIEAVVPPGVTTGKGPLGDVELGSAPFPRLVAVPLHARLSADGRSETAVRVFAFTADGLPLAKAAVTLDVDRGRIAKPQTVAPGIFTVRYQAPNELGVASFVARLSGDAASVVGLKLPIVTPRPDRVEVTFEPREHRAGEPPPTIKVAVLDEAGNPTAGAVSFRVVGATVGEVQQVTPGRWESTLQIPDKLPGRTLPVTVTADGVEATATLRLHAAAPAKVVTMSGDGAVVADGEQVSDVLVLVSDRYGNPVEGAKPRATAERGTLLSVDEVGAGQYRARYLAPLDYSGGADNVIIRATDDVTTSARVELVASRKLLLLGAHVGFTSNLVSLYAPTVALDATLQGSGLLDGFLLNLEAGGLYTFGQAQITQGPLAGTTVDTQLFAVPLVLTGGYRLRLGDASLFAGAGGEMDYVYSVVAATSTQSLAFGALGQLGATYHLGPGEIVVKARYTYGGLQGAYGAGTVWAGYSFDVF